MATAPNSRICFPRTRFGDWPVDGCDLSVVVVALVVPVSVVTSDGVVSDVVVSVVVDSVDVVVVAVVDIGVGTAGLGRLDWFEVCTTANTIATITRTPSPPAATTAIVV
jgi:hypothetical protein